MESPFITITIYKSPLYIMISCIMTVNIYWVLHLCQALKSFIYILLFNPHVSPLGHILFLFPFYRWGHRYSRSISEFPFAVVTNYYKLRCLNNTDLLPDNSGGSKSQMCFTRLKSRCQQGCIPSGGSTGEFISFPLPDSRGHLHFFACVPFLQIPSQPSYNSVFCFHRHISFLDSSAFLFHLLRTLVITWSPPR